jgi:hypothetical protein
VWCRWDTQGLSCRFGVQLGDEFSIGGACRVEVLVALFKLDAQVYCSLF